MEKLNPDDYNVIIDGIDIEPVKVVKRRVSLIDPIIEFPTWPCECGSKRFYDHGDSSFTCANKACRKERFE